MKLLIKPDNNRQQLVHVTPESANWGYVSFSVYQLAPGETITVSEDAKELCAIVLTGIVSAEAGGQTWNEIGGRKTVFDDAAPHAIYLRPGAKLTVTAKTETELALGGAPARGEHPVRLIEPASMRRLSRGKGTNTRHVCEILPEDQPAESLLIFEVKTPSSHSSSYPPHNTTSIIFRPKACSKKRIIIASIRRRDSFSNASTPIRATSMNRWRSKIAMLSWFPAVITPWSFPTATTLIT